MSARTTSEAIRHATQPIKLSRRKPKTKRPEHGAQIYVYSHLQKNHVVYSLTRALKNNASLAQLPFNGKKTVPAALRKDLWHPLALISFQPGHGSIGLSVFQKLREYRRRHELEWDLEIMKDQEDKEERKLIEKKWRKWILCDQKANSVADIAAVLGHLEKKDAKVVEEDENKQQGTPRRQRGGIGLIGEGTGEKVEVLWNDLNDAEFAETWSENVEHGVWKHRPSFEEDLRLEEEMVTEEIPDTFDPKTVV